MSDFSVEIGGQSYKLDPDKVSRGLATELQSIALSDPSLYYAGITGALVAMSVRKIDRIMAPRVDRIKLREWCIEVWDQFAELYSVDQIAGAIQPVLTALSSKAIKSEEVAAAEGNSGESSTKTSADSSANTTS